MKGLPMATRGVLPTSAPMSMEGRIGFPERTGCRRVCLFPKPWDTPFNNPYLNITRDGLPNVFTLDDLIDRTLRITEPAILEEGGRKEEKNGRTVLIVPCSFEGGK